MKLHIAVPSNRDWKPAFGNSLVNIAMNLTKEGVDLGVSVLDRGSDLVRARQELVENALTKKATHLLFLDDDMKINLPAIRLLISRNKDFVAANCVTRGQEPKPVTKKENGDLVFSHGKSGIEKIYKTGLACALIKTEVFKKLSPPYFQSGLVYNEQRTAAVLSPEDYYFCSLLNKSGVELYVDHDAARHVWHIGDYLYQERF